MGSAIGILLLLLVTSATSPARQSSSSSVDQKVRRIEITRTLKLPVLKLIDPNRVDAETAQQAASPAIWPGATDEPPEGPSGFDVFDDGSIVITDPLLQRLVLYDINGKFQHAWVIGFPADSVRVTSTGTMLVHQAHTGEMYALDREGRIHKSDISTEVEVSQARVTSGTSGMILGVGSDKKSLTIQYDEQGSRLLSLESLANDPERGSFVALETSATGDADSINVRKLLRRYSLAGVLISESSALPLDYYIQPVDEIRVRKGVMYQLMTTPTEVRINEWDTN